MSSTLTLEGNIMLGPQNACEGGAAGLLNLPFGLGGSGCSSCVAAPAKAYNTKKVSTNSPAFSVLPGLGASDVVTKAKFLYLRSSGAVKLRFTQTSGVQVVDVNGLCIMQFPNALELVLLEVQGTADLEYIFVGDV